MKKLTKKQKTTILTVVGVAIIAFGGTYAYGQSQSSKKLEETKQELVISTNNLSDLDKEVVALLDSKDSNYLVKNVKEEQITKLKEQVKGIVIFKVDNTDLQKEINKYNRNAETTLQDMDRVETSYKTQTALNNLFKQTDKEVAMNGTDVKKDLPIADNLQKETVEQVKKDYFNDKFTDSYHKVVNELITNAQNQVNQLEKAKTEVAKVYKDGKVVSTDTKAYDTAKAETDKVKNEKSKKDLSDQLTKVKADIDKKAKEEADKNNQSASANGTAQASETSQANANGTANGDTGTGSNATAGNSTGSGGYTDNGYTPSGSGQGSNTGGNGEGYTPPTNNGGGSTGGANTQAPQTPTQPDNGNNTIVVNPDDIQGSEPNNNSGGSSEWWGW